MIGSASRILRCGATLLAATLTASTAAATPYGICAHVASDELLEMTVAAKVEWVRIDFNWLAVEPEQDVFDWSVYDRLIPAARARGLRIFASLAYTPAWATDGEEWTGVPRDPNDWHDVCYRAAARYRGLVDAWGMWNEPNLRGFWSGTRQQYIDVILRPGSAAVRAADSAAQVAGPDLAHLSGADWDTWLEVVLNQAADALDVVTHHAYPSGTSHQDVTDKLASGGPNPWDPPAVRTILRRTGWFGRPFWLTETGYQSARDGEYRQATFYRDLLGDWFGANREQDWVDRMFFYQLEDDPRFTEQSWGILTAAPDSTPKQAYFAYLNFVRNALVDDADVLSSTAPAVLPALTEAGFEVTLRNTGTTTWSDASGYRLGAITDDCTALVEPGRLDASRTVPPGATVTVGVRVRTSLWFPADPPRRCTLGWRMAVGGDPFGDELRHRIVVSEIPPPIIIRHPVPWAGPEGATLVLGAEAASARELSYRWQRNGLDLEDDGRITGAGSAVLQVADLGPADAGEYRCLIRSTSVEEVTRRAAVVVTRPEDRVMRAGGPRVGVASPAVPFSGAGVAPRTVTGRARTDQPVR